MENRKNRLLTMIFGAFAIFFTGFPHIWSIYSPYVAEQTGWTEGQTSLCFYLALSVFVFGNIIGGRLLNQWKARTVVIVGGGLFSLGVLAASFSFGPSPLMMYLTYGILQGFGQGMIYTVILSAAQKWFPDRTGFGSGIVVTANGLCGLFLAPVSRKLLEQVGPQRTLFLVGLTVALSWILVSIFFRMPDETVVPQAKASSGDQKQYTSGEMIRTKRFYLLLATMLFSLISYFMVSPVSQTLQLSRGVPSAVAVSAVMLGSVMNAGSRLVLPSIADKAGRVICIKAVLIVELVAMGMLIFCNSYMVTAAVVLMYGCYGGIMGSFPAFTSSIFGIEHTGENYGFVMLSIVIANLATPVISSALVTAEGDMRPVFRVGLICILLGIIALTLLEKELKINTKNEKRG
jgi:OFA family oxalate/formate antiporter-like MFS transporter